jgi:hypothetical protein
VDALGDGSLLVKWKVSPLGCEAAGVELVEVKLRNAHRSYVESFECAEAQGVVSGINAATYELEVLGLNSSGFAIFSAPSRTVTVGAEKLNATELLRLNAKPAELTVTWSFENGLVCGSNEVSEIEIAVYDHSSFEHARRRVDCSAGRATIGGLIAGDYIVQALSAGDSAPYSGLAHARLKRGGSAEVLVELRPE